MWSFDALAVPVLSAVAGASIRAAVLAAIAALLIRALRKPSAPLRHALWTVVTVAMLALPFVPGLLPPLQLPRLMERVDWAIVRVPPLEPVAAAPQPAHRTEPILIQVSDAGTVNPATAARPLVGWPALIAALYICGVVAVLLRVGTGLFLAERLAAQSSTLRDTRANELLRELASAQQLSFPWPCVFESDAVSVPLVLIGHGSSIVLPSQWREWDDWKLRAVLSHELAHLRRRDYLILLVAALNKAVFWFHPLAWWLETRLSGLCEQASDDAAVLATGDPVRYARVVLDLANEARNAGRRLLRPVSALSIDGAGNISRRIDRLLEEHTWSPGVFPYRSWRAAALVSVPLVTLLAAAQVSQSPASTKAGDVTPGWSWISEGFNTTAEQARQLEEGLAREPDDLAARAKLVAYYLYNVNRDAVTRHAMWVIEHHPESELAGSEPVNTGYMGDPTVEEARRRQVEKNQLWLLQAARHNRNPRVIGHAGAALMMTDLAEAERLLLKARELDGANNKWLRHLVRLYAEAVITDSYQAVGLIRFGWPQRVDSGFAARIRAELDRSEDTDLVGSVGSDLANFVVHTRETRAGQETQIAQARRSISEYASSLLKRAATNEPARAEWTDSLRMLSNPSMGANASDKPSAWPYKIPPAQQKELLVSSTPPVYPPLARQARIQGVVRFRIRIGTDGRVKTTALVHGHPLLVASAENSARTHVYTPTLLNGQPIEVETLVDVNFSLSGQE